jgi:hypothetical protein
MSEAINTNKSDPLTIFRRSIDKVISDTTHGVSTAAVVGYLRSCAQRIEDQNYRGQYVPSRMYNGSTGELIDYAKQADEARAERQRRIDQRDVIPPHLRQSAASGLKR